MILTPIVTGLQFHYLFCQHERRWTQKILHLIQNRNFRLKSEKQEPRRFQSSDGSPSRYLEEGYGKPSQPPRRSFLNCCKSLIGIKEKPSNCSPSPSEPETEETFWDYLFKFDDKRPKPDPSNCRVAYLHYLEACRKTDPRLSDPRYRPTQGDVLLFTELQKPSVGFKLTEPQPNSPPSYIPPKVVTFQKLSQISSFTPALACTGRKYEYDIERSQSCSEPRPFRVPFEECRPPQMRPPESFSCDRRILEGRFVEKIFDTKATISRSHKSLCDSFIDIKKLSQLQKLRQLTKLADCIRDPSFEESPKSGKKQ